MRRLVLGILTCLVLCAPALASDAQDELYDALDVAEAEEALPDEARDILGDVGVEDAMEPEGMLSRLADAAWDKLGSLWRPAAGAAASPEGWALFPTGCLSMNEGSPLVTKSLALSALLEGLTPAESQTAESRSEQSVMNSASA